MTTTNTKEMAMSLATRREIEYDILNGLFSDASDANIKYYRDEDNSLDIEVETRFIDWGGYWQFFITVSDDNGEEYTLAEGQWKKLHNAFEGDLEWRGLEAQSEAEHIKQLWRSAYA
jgi:hypothetical protein